MTNKDAHEEAAGMNLEPLFFKLSDIDPDAEYIGSEVIYATGAHIPKQCYIDYGRDLDGCSSQENGGCKSCILYRDEVKE
jgi:hypothetical protein